jgi:Anti-sigma-K factor rskA
VAITPDQRATLQLLLERGQSYADLATLLGVDEGGVRGRARAALTELGGADPDRNVGLTDYLLGQADPIGRADASRHLREDAEDHALASTLAERLGEMFPSAELPRLPGEPRRRRRLRPAPAGEGEAPARRGTGLSASQTRLIVVLASAAVLLVAVVLAITGAFGGGDDDSSAVAEETTTTEPPAGEEEIQRVTLRATSGGDASGEALFGLASGDQPFIELAIDGLDPAPQEQQYVVWLMLTRTQGYPLSPITVDQQGSFSNRFPIPSAVLPVVARVRFVDVSIAQAKEIRKVVRGALEESSLVLDKPGRTVLRGTIPRAGEQGTQ